MSDEEYSEEEYSEEEREEKRVAKPQEHQEHKEEPKLKHVERKDAEEEAPPREMTEAERAMEAARRKKKEEDEARWAEYQQLRAIERAKEEEELKRLKDRQTMRRKERDEEDARMAEQRRIMEEQRQLEETEIMARKSEEKKRRLAEAERRRMELMGATGQTDASNSPNFVITKKANEGTSKEAIGKRSAAQLEREKEAYMKKRVKPCNVSGWDAARLKEKAQQLHARIIKLETERFDLEQKSQRQEYDLKELKREREASKETESAEERTRPNGGRESPTTAFLFQAQGGGRQQV
ncbi:PREDICTED: troponin T-like isoform X1 [Priapulus caudatus]|uniref:Troponin T-like isoform X1 n=1 Tax=Priapulus caudatus TaxID=37621 RepID=A0ABM1DR74_PRICU|nr:PREDICTED: troponin T-like isoform X1 [Priapulus caudatus]